MQRYVIKIYGQFPVVARDMPTGKPLGDCPLWPCFYMSNDSGMFRASSQLECDGWILNGNVFVRDGMRMTSSQ